MKAYFIIAGLFLGIAPVVTAQKIVYSDGRPAASLRMNATDEGIVMKYGDGPDSCDTYGAREAVVVKEKDTYYLFYDGAGKDGWISCMAESKDLKSWSKTGAILSLGDSGRNDHKSASSPWVIKQGNTWHMFYIGTPNTTPAPYSIPAFPYLTMKASSSSITGPCLSLLFPKCNYCCQARSLYEQHSIYLYLLTSTPILRRYTPLFFH